MTMKHKTMSHRGFAVMLGALGLIAVACSDDDDDGGDNTAGKGGSSAGKGGSSAGKGGSSAGKGGNGGSSAGTAGTAGTAGSGQGGDIGIAGEGQGGDVGMAGEGQGGEPQGGQGQGGEAVGGSGDGGAGGAPEIIADTLDNGDFSGYDTGWTETGDADGAKVAWRSGTENPELQQWRATAYQVSTWQTVSPLPNGTYTFSMDVMRGTGLTLHYLFARGCKAGQPNEEVTKDTTAATADAYTTITLANIEVTSGSCQVGVHVAAEAGGWANLDNAVFTKVD